MMPARTRDGRAALIYRTNHTLVAGSYRYPIKALVENESAEGDPCDWSFMSNGQFKSNDSRNARDIVIWLAVDL